MLGLTADMSAADRPSLTVVAYNQAGVADETLTRAKVDVARIVGETGVDVTWAQPAVEPVSSFIIRLLIRPRAVGTSGSIMGTTLGDVHETGGSAFVFYDRVLRSAHEQEQDVARVLAYAMAHEMGHLLLLPAAHASSGIMRAAWDGDDLRRIGNGSMQFTPAQQRAIRVKAETCAASSAMPKP
jgi:hypothetical protein